METSRTWIDADFVGSRRDIHRADGWII